MCTLVIGRDILAPGSLWLAANRDEAPRRPSDPPAVLHPAPRVVGGRDRVAGGTWLAVRETRLVVALLNRRPGALTDARLAMTNGNPIGTTGAPVPGLRSRGLLTLDLAAQPDPGFDADRALDLAQQAVVAHRYGPFSLVCATAAGGWVLSHPSAGPMGIVEIAPGWHVITHADLDDPSEPRTAWLLEDLAAWRPTTRQEIERGLIERLRDHGAVTGARTHPAVCIHEGVMVTVSSSIVHLEAGRARYLHAEGRPCEAAFRDHGGLLSGLPLEESA
jgi:hypothetical protein